MMSTVTKIDKPVTRRITFASHMEIIREVERNTDASILMKVSYCTPLEIVEGDTIYTIPRFQIADFEELIEEDAQEFPERTKKLTLSSESKRHFVSLFRGVVIKSAQKGILYPFFDIEHPNKRIMRQEKAGLEYIYTNSMHNILHGHVVRHLGIIESLKSGQELGKGEFYLFHKYFPPLEDPAQSEKKTRAYTNFQNAIAKQGFRYAPVHTNRPYEDLVVRTKKDGNLEVLASGLPQIEKLK